MHSPRLLSRSPCLLSDLRSLLLPLLLPLPVRLT